MLTFHRFSSVTTFHLKIFRNMPYCHPAYFVHFQTELTNRFLGNEYVNESGSVSNEKVKLTENKYKEGKKKETRN